MSGALAVTGAHGFLGWHTRVRARAAGWDAVGVGLGPTVSLDEVADAVCGADSVLHLAGVNRGSDDEVRSGNFGLATRLAAGIRRAAQPPSRVVYANSIHAGTEGAYGESKARAAEILAGCAAQVGAEFVDVVLPNLFGEHGRAFYNSVTATFCHQLAGGETPRVLDDGELTLLHVQDAAEVLLGIAKPQEIDLRCRPMGVGELCGVLTQFAEVYATGAIPTLDTPFDVALFNTYRSFTPRSRRPLVSHSDPRGSFSEVVRCHGGSGQTSFSTTAPGVTRGEHFHLGKVERFAVLSGAATISLRKVLTDEVVHIDVDGSEPSYVDMPTLWAHNITNVGTEVLRTVFWTNDLFDPANPDTFAEAV